MIRSLKARFLAALIGPDLWGEDRMLGDRLPPFDVPPSIFDR